MRLCLVVEDQRSLYVISAVLRALNPSPLLVPGLCTASALFKLGASLPSDDNRIRWQAGGLLTSLPCHINSASQPPFTMPCSLHTSHSSCTFFKPLFNHETTPSFLIIKTMPPANPSTTETHEEESWLCQGCTWINKGGSYCASCGYPRSAGD